MNSTVTTLVLAGSRPGNDPLLADTGIATKALFPVEGKPMLAHVLAALSKAAEVGRIIVAAQDVQDLADSPALAEFTQIDWRTSQGSIADTVAAIVTDCDGPLFVTTTDNVLLTPGMVGQFLREARGSDVAAGLVERRKVAAAGYSTQRTWLPFRKGYWSGANLFLLGGAGAAPLLAFWKGIEQDRKKGLKIIGAFGPVLLLGTLLRLLDIHGFARRAGKRFGLSAKVVEMEAAEACIDADKPADIPVIEAILAERQTVARAASTASRASLSSSS